MAHQNSTHSYFIQTTLVHDYNAILATYQMQSMRNAPAIKAQ